MADLYGSNESEDMSSFLQILLHNSSSSAAATGGANASAAGAGGFFNCGGAAGVSESSSNMGLADPSCFFAKESDGLNSSFRVKNLNSSFEGYEGSEVPVNPARSSKRTRAAEVHNLTEKRRRSRINEKLKALQKLIPNSNKTDKASMLDEAIEYLKQLQLQVQMLTLRNGLGSHPYYPLGSLQSMAVPPTGLELDERDVVPTGHQDVFTQGTLQNTNQSSSTHPTVTPSVAINTNSGIVPSYIPTTYNHYGLLNHIASSKDIYWDDTDSRLRLDMSCSGNDSSPGVSS